MVILRKNEKKNNTQLLNKVIDKKHSHKEAETIVRDEKDASLYRCTITLALTEANGTQNNYEATCSVIRILSARTMIFHLY